MEKECVRLKRLIRKKRQKLQQLKEELDRLRTTLFELQAELGKKKGEGCPMMFEEGLWFCCKLTGQSRLTLEAFWAALCYKCKYGKENAKTGYMLKQLGVRDGTE